MTPEEEIDCLIQYSGTINSDWQLRSIKHQIKSLESVVLNRLKLIPKEHTNKFIKCIGADCTIYESITDCSKRTGISVHTLRKDFDKGSVKYGIKKIF